MLVRGCLGTNVTKLSLIGAENVRVSHLLPIRIVQALRHLIKRGHRIVLLMRLQDRMDANFLTCLRLVVLACQLLLLDLGSI